MRMLVADIKAWLPKVRDYGFIAGHDYSWDDEVLNAAVHRYVSYY